MEMPIEDGICSVDDKGRLKLPTRFHDALISLQEEWFVLPEGDGKTFYIAMSGEAELGTRIDANGRILVPPDWSAPFKKKPVQIFWQKDRLVVTTEDLRNGFSDWSTNVFRC